MTTAPDEDDAAERTRVLAVDAGGARQQPNALDEDPVRENALMDGLEDD